ncbi:MAG TPA: hypothetical protein VLA82_06320 [Actinomycetota bacterium]|nr:hypothetical protein [Actinomycetota bacterium]
MLRSRPRPIPRGLRTLIAIVVTTAALASCDAYVTRSGSSTVTPHLTPAPSGAGTALTSSPCDVPDTGDAVTVETLRTVDRPCVDPGDAVIVRCDPALDPIAVIGAGTDAERVFLGGSFAVPVEDAPGSAVELGIAASGRYRIDPEDDRLLYLQAGGEAERWLALPRPRLVAEPPTALMVGDSILEGSAAATTEALAGWTLSIDALVGRPSSGGVEVVEAASSSPDAVVVELGTNDHDAASFRTNADRILAASVVADADLVVWITAHSPEQVTPEVNREIVRAVSTVPQATVADWDRAVPLDALNGDGVHLAPGSEGVFADFLAPVLETWRATVHRRGPARCLDAAIAALP